MSSEQEEKKFKTGRDEELEKLFPKISIPNVEENEDFFYGTFPEGFKWGCSTSAYQVEGGWDADGKGETDWDHHIHQFPDKVDDKTNANVAADSYHRYKEDVQLLKNMGATTYRLSLSWARILPNGTKDKINEKGIEYYRNLLDELIENGIEPIVTLYHWDLPQAIADKYSWLDEELIDLFADYCRVVYERLGDKVKYFLTINEPFIVAIAGFDLGIFAPFKSEPATGTYRSLHNLLKSHAVAYRIYEKEFKEIQKGKVGIALCSWWIEPADPNNPEDVIAAKRAMEFRLGSAAYPLLHGCYPPTMREYVDKKSKEEGRTESRLPHFDEEWSKKIQGSYDFIGLNHYSSELVTVPSRAPKDIPEVHWSSGNPGIDTDQEIFQYHDPAWPNTLAWWCKFTPWGFRKLLNYIKNEYNNPEVIVTENGCSGDPKEVEDTERINYFRGYLNDMLKAIRIDGCNVTGYAAWSLIDGWEWMSGHTVTLGVHKVDFNDPLRKRSPRASAKFLEKIFKDNGFVKS